MGRRQNVLVLAGVAALLIGLALVFVVLRDDGDEAPGASGAPTVEVLVATDDIEAGTKGEAAQANVAIRRVNQTDRHADALTTPSQLSNRLFTANFKSGEQIRSAGLTAQSQVTPIAVPAGKEAVSLQLPFPAAGGGYLAPGDLINVFQMYPNGVPGTEASVKLLLTNVQVIDVQTQAAPLSSQNVADGASSVSRAGVGGSVVLVLALDTVDAEKAIFGNNATGSNLYVTLVNDDAPPVGDTPGRTHQNQLDEDPAAAHARTNAGQ